MSFKNKRILFFSVKTFDYEKFIRNKLIDAGCLVDYFDERPSNSILAKGLIRINRSFYVVQIREYYNSILKKIKENQYDFLFVIKGEVVPEYFIKAFKQLNPNCVLIYYTWDSFMNNPNGLSILNLFDKKFTFDKNDAQKYNLNLRPLFFIDPYGELRNSQNEVPESKLLFIGTAHSDRYIISQRVVNWCKQNGIKFRTYYYMPGIWVFIYKYLFDKTFVKFDIACISFKSLGINEVINLYKEANIILDINHPGQSGLTMRTFETLGAGKKLVTTNEHIAAYPIYNENNVFIIKRDQPAMSRSFFETPYIAYDYSVYQKMSITGWLNEIFFSDGSDFWI